MICILSYVDDNDDDYDYVKYTLQLSWFTLPETRPEPDPEPGLLTITRPEPDPKSKSAIHQALTFNKKCFSVNLGEVKKNFFWGGGKFSQKWVGWDRVQGGDPI